MRVHFYEVAAPVHFSLVDISATGVLYYFSDSVVIFTHQCGQYYKLVEIENLGYTTVPGSQ